MAAPLRVVRRPKGSPARRALTAASQLVVDPQKQLKKSTFGVSRQDWQLEAWEHSEEVGELAYYVSWRANSCSRVQLIASEIDPDTGMPTGGLPTTDTGELTAEARRVAEIVKTIAGGPLGQAELIKRVTECLTIPGELWICVLVRTEKVDGVSQKVERWFAITREEMRTKTGGEVEIDLPDQTKHSFNPALDSMVRVWNPRPRRASEATSPVRACLEPLREIQRTTKKIKNAAKSRIINNGVLFLPQELSLPDARAPIAEDQAEIPGMPIPTVEGVSAADRLGELLYAAGIAATKDDESHAALIPLMATVPAEHLKNILHLKFGNDVTDVEIKTRIDAITRLAMGLDVSPERLLGMSKGNHWSAWQIGDEDVQLHIKPIMDTICKAIYESIVRVIFVRENIDPTRYLLWYDASKLTADPDLTDEAVEAHDRGAINSARLRQLLNIGEEGGYDMTTLEGLQEFARDMIAKKPELLMTYLPVLAHQNPELEGIDFPQPALPAAPGDDDEEADDEDSGAGKQEEPGTEDDAAAVISSSVELILAERLLINRALDLAGKRRFSVTDRDQKARLRGFAPHDYHRVMGPVRESEIPKLISGWDSALLADDVIKRLGVAAPLRAAVLRAVQRELTREVIDAEVSA